MSNYRQESVDAVTPVVVNNTGQLWRKAILTPASANIRVRYDGIAPTTTVGETVFQNGSYVIEGPGFIENAQIIATAGTATVGINLQ